MVETSCKKSARIKKSYTEHTYIIYLLTIFISLSTAVLAGNDTFLTENIIEDRKKFITQSKRMIF